MNGAAYRLSSDASLWDASLFNATLFHTMPPMVPLAAAAVLIFGAIDLGALPGRPAAGSVAPA